jgi:DNA-binding NtrC family response regulator
MIYKAWQPQPRMAVNAMRMKSIASKKMPPQASKSSSDKELERLMLAIEKECVVCENGEDYAMKALSAAMSIIGIDDVVCEIAEKKISILPRGKRAYAAGRQKESEFVLSKTDEAVYKAEWKSEPTYQTTTENFYQGRRARAEQVIAYAGKTIGRIYYTQSASDQRRSVEQNLIATVARYIAYFINRCEIRRWSQERYGRPLTLIGSNRKIHTVEQRIERASRSILPVLIEGEYGTEKLDIAMTIHGSSIRINAPFVDVDCSNPHIQLADSIVKAKSGSLCLHNIDQLSRCKQAFLQSQIHSHLGQWIGSTSPDDVRIISTASGNLRKLVHDGRFLPMLYAELSILNILVPPVRERVDDIAMIIINLISDLGMETTYAFHEDALAILRSYRWPGNLFEMKMLIASITMVSDGGEVTATDLITHAPWLNQKDTEENNYKSSESRLQIDAVGSAQLESWLQDFSEQKIAVIGTMHEGLRKAIQVLLKHFAEPISLHDLAKVANLSPSHLSFLFREVAKTSFKDIQHCVRITKAKELLRWERQMPIAEVAKAIGYVDLSHFEWNFRRRVGMRPRDYRRSTEKQGTRD